jgi:hypothetical protein
MLNESKFKMYDQLRATIKLPNINGNTDRIFLLEYYDDIYWPIFLLLNPLVNTDNNILMVYTKGISVEKKGIKKISNSLMTYKFYRRLYQHN